MSVIEGWYETTRPYTAGLVRCHDLGTIQPVRFLIDSGADLTILHPKDVYGLGIDVKDLTPDAPARGLGGEQRYAVREASITLDDVNGNLYRYDIPVLLSLDSIPENSFPSLLGQDILQRMALMLDPTQNPGGTLEPTSWDARVNSPERTETP